MNRATKVVSIHAPAKGRAPAFDAASTGGGFDPRPREGANSLFTSTIEGVSDTFRAAGISLLVADSHYSALEEEEVLTRILGQRPCGLVLHGTTHTDRTRSMIARSGISVVEVGNLTENPLDMVASYSNAAASRAMTLHLAKRGYRRIAFVSLPVELTERAAERRRGYFEAKAEAGLEHDAAWLVEAPQGFAAGAQALNVLMDLRRRPDCVFSAGDVLAFGALMEASRKGWAVPKEIAIAGFDDHEFADQLIPAVTTLRIPRYEIGVISARMLLDRLENRVPDPVWDCGFELIQREST